MVFLDSVLTWLAEKILNYLLGKAYNAAIDVAEDLKRDKERGETNDKNIKAYEEATARKDRITAALDLLNRNAH